MSEPIYVTKPSLASLQEYVEVLKGVWDRGILTHNGPLVQELELELKEKLDLRHLSLVSNGTIALQMAIKCLELQGEIITTPFTWIASVSAIKWEGCTPVFCDIEEDTLNIDPSKIEELITPSTCAIMPVHVFGNPCDIEAIEAVAKKHNLRVIYDAAHAVGSLYKGKSLLEAGDISATSLHATKLLNTAEGGACITKDEELHRKLERIRFFGHNEKKDVVEDGFNGKMTEVHAALGLANLKYYDPVLIQRKMGYTFYKEALSVNTTLKFQFCKLGECNYSYFPVIFHSEEQLVKVEKKLRENQIFPRRYFYPSVNTFDKVVERGNVPISEDVSMRILCLPLYYELERKDYDLIANLVLETLD